MPNETRSIGVTPIVSSASKINCPAPQHFYLNASTVNPRLDKIYFTASYKMIPLLYMYHYHGYGYINQKLLKTLPTSGGADVHSSLTLIAISGIVFIICQLSGVNAFAFFTQIGK